jgi:hypothetical protein
MRFRAQPFALVFSLVALALAVLTGVVIPLSSGFGPGAMDMNWTPPPTATPTLQPTPTPTLQARGRATDNRAASRPQVAPTGTPAAAGITEPAAALVASAASTPAVATAAAPAATATELPSPSATLPATAMPGATPGAQASIPDGPVNLRAGPGAAFAVLATGKTSEEYSVRGRSEDGNWVLLCCVAGAPVWASAELINLPAALDSYPIVP